MPQTNEWPDVIYEDILDADTIDAPEGYEPIDLDLLMPMGFPIRVDDEIPPNCLRLVDSKTGRILFEQYFETEEEFGRFMNDLDE